MIYRFFVHLMALVSTREKSESNQKTTTTTTKRAQTTHIPFRKYAWKNSASNNFIAQQQQQQKIKNNRKQKFVGCNNNKNKYI